MAEIQDLNVTDASNVGRWPENMQFSAVNDAGRADEGLLARWYQDMNASVTASGSSNAFTATSNRTISSLVNNTIMVFTANHTISGAATLNLNGLGAKNIKRFSGDALGSGDITSGQPVSVIYKSSPDQWYMMNATAQLITAIPTFADFTENASPGTPAVNVARLYAYDAAGLTWIAFNDNAGNIRPLLTPATQADMEAANSTLLGPTVAVQHYHPAHPKAWAIVSSVGALSTGSGVTSSAKTATGTYTVTLTTAMSSTAYAAMVTVQNASTTTPLGAMYVPTSTTVITVRVFDTATQFLTDAAFSIAVLGDQ